MIRALSLSARQMFSTRIAGVVGACIILSISCFVAIWYGLGWAAHAWLPETGWIADVAAYIADMGGGVLIAGVLAYFLFPFVTTSLLGFFLERVATIVEAQHYPNLPPAKGPPLVQSLLITLRFLVTLIGANLLLLLFLPFPPIYAFAALVINGWLVGHEYFEQVAIRRLSRRDADQLRKRRSSKIMVTGIVMILLLTIPLFSLVLPVFATCVMVHHFEEWNDIEAT